MQYIKNKINEIIKLPEILEKYISKEDIIVFDIETTGLSHKYHKCILIGFITYEDNSFFVHQIFCDSSLEESQLLNSFINITKDTSIFITYNGDSFDIPFLNSRLNNNKINHSIFKEQNFDLLRLIRSQNDLLNLPNLKLKTLEKHLGINREDTISGKESMDLYRHYEKMGDESAKRKILLHNKEDIIYLLKCISIVKQINEDELLDFIPIKINLKYENDKIQKNAYLSNVKTKGDKLIIMLKAPNLLNMDYRHYDSILSLTYDEHSQTLSLELPTFIIQTEYEILRFIDVDLLKIEDKNFNELTIEKRLQYLCSKKQNKIECFNKINITNITSTIINNILFNN